MKKLIIITLCLFVSLVLTYKVVPKAFPGITKLENYNSTDIKDIYEAGFGERVDRIEGALEENNAEGVQYMINDKKDLGQLMESNSDSSEETVETTEENSETEETTSENSTYNDISELTNITLNDIVLSEISADYFIFTVNGNSYQMNGLGVIGNTEIYVKSVDPTNGLVTISPGEHELHLQK